MSNNFFNVILFISLTSQLNEIDFKNKIRKMFLNYDLNLGNELNLDIFLENIKNNKNYKIKSLKIFKQNKYFIYGKSTSYKIILNKNYT